MPTTSFSVTTPAAADATGYVQSDGFVSPVAPGVITGTDGQHSKGPAKFPFGLGLTGATVAAAGASAGNATTVTAALIKVTATASTEGIKLTTAYPLVIVAIPGGVGSKVYPPTGAILNALSTNTALVQAKQTTSLYAQVSATAWVQLKGS